jgi:hypothetical protein
MHAEQAATPCIIHVGGVLQARDAAGRTWYRPRAKGQLWR